MLPSSCKNLLYPECFFQLISHARWPSWLVGFVFRSPLVQTLATELPSSADDVSEATLAGGSSSLGERVLRSLRRRRQTGRLNNNSNDWNIRRAHCSERGWWHGVVFVRYKELESRAAETLRYAEELQRQHNLEKHELANDVRDREVQCVRLASPSPPPRVPKQRATSAVR